MNRYSLVVLAGLLAATPVASAADHDNDHDRALGLRDKGEILPLTEIITRTSSRYPGQILEVELKKEEDGRRVYEIEVLGEDDVVREIIVDAADGSIISVEDE